jgi:8-oxo-dGTP pyrophosphatase MutT (NUDIX family)
MNKKCGIILFDEKKQSYLLVFGKKSQKWGFPKGHMEVGETTRETAIREFYEETGFTLNNVTFDNTFIIKNNTYFVININDEKRHLIQKANYIPDTKEIQFFEWIPKQNMLNMDILSCNFGLKAYINRLKRQPEFSEKLRPLLAVQINK